MTYCCLSLDDDDIEYWLRVAEALEPYGAKMTCFITTAEIMPLEEADLFSLSFSGHEMAVHAWDHRSLAHIHSSVWPHQIMDASDWIEQRTGVPVTSMAYPYGQSNEELRQYVKSTGRFLGARSIGHRIQPIPQLDPFAVPVINRKLLIGDGAETTVRINALKYHALCAANHAPFMFYSHNNEDMTVKQIKWIVDELARENQKFITFSDMLRLIL